VSLSGGSEYESLAESVSVSHVETVSIRKLEVT
jgi:hypothetical protein